MTTTFDNNKIWGRHNLVPVVNVYHNISVDFQQNLLVDANNLIFAAPFLWEILLFQYKLNSYGVQPFYMGLEEDGNAHGVLLLNSNGMGREKNKWFVSFFQHSTILGGRFWPIWAFVAYIFRCNIPAHASSHLPHNWGDFGLLCRSGSDTRGRRSAIHWGTTPPLQSPLPEFGGCCFIFTHFWFYLPLLQLVGRPVMPPYWALGFQLCRYGYENDTEIAQLVEGMKAARIPYVRPPKFGEVWENWGTLQLLWHCLTWKRWRKYCNYFCYLKFL